MTVMVIAFPAERPARWHALLRERLARRWPGALVALTPTGGGGDWATSVDQLLALVAMRLAVVWSWLDAAATPLTTSPTVRSN